jgi:hypothetical protein
MNDTVYEFGPATDMEHETPQVEVHKVEVNPKLLHASGQFWEQIERQLSVIERLVHRAVQFGKSRPEKK